MYSTGDDVPDEENCCKSVLDDRPLFTAQGTCFYTKRRIYEAHPYTWSSVEAWLKFDGEQSPSKS